MHCRKIIKDEAETKEKEAGATAIDRKTRNPTNDNNEFSFLSDFTYFFAHSVEDWYADSGATQHMSGQRSFFRNFVPVKHNTWFINGIRDTCL